MAEKTNKIGIVLSGGAVRCIAHLGVIKALHEHDIRPSCISGVSAGAIAGAFYAEGKEPEEILDFFLNKKLMSFIGIKFNKGLANMQKLHKALEELLNAKSFSDLEKQLFITSTNLNTAETITFHEGSLVDKIVASSSIPVLFEPVDIDGELYVDGGMMNNMPLEPLQEKCDKIIGVNVNPIGYRKYFKNLRSIAERTFHLTVMANFLNKVDEFDVYIEPSKLEKFGLFDLSQGKDIFDAGYEHTKSMFDKGEINL
ncbi:MAG: patatin-like phospholipase family protein [Bacteroidales bacterium]|nr:patatin-like phospholipase family protein [Bacteroidales bacterium]MCF8343263.1 patatin-like phospholipase family protein [Bacteroidales bacterium]MCF8351297.1 patatin-like phospholipase family protein [Bacteroidales bacterium]MCF8376427.1 patatin-like phospholipase family protein [Bacteroidales bacterium]MCF8400546.1 patatin-like phospholipase family protein [Bacteroidales bacterium]